MRPDSIELHGGNNKTQKQWWAWAWCNLIVSHFRETERKRWLRDCLWFLSTPSLSLGFWSVHRNFVANTCYCCYRHGATDHRRCAARWISGASASERARKRETAKVSNEWTQLKDILSADVLRILFSCRICFVSAPHSLLYFFRIHSVIYVCVCVRWLEHQRVDLVWRLFESIIERILRLLTMLHLRNVI